MKLEIHGATDDANAKVILESICTFIDYPFPEKQIRSISYTHNGMSMTATVGKDVPPYYGVNAPYCIVILYDPKRDCYAICARDRGVTKGSPIFAGGKTVTSVSYIEDE